MDDDEMVEQAQQMIVKELKGLLEKDVMERVVGTHLKMMVAREKVKRGVPKTKASGQEDSGEQRAEKRDSKGSRSRSQISAYERNHRRLL